MLSIETTLNGKAITGQGFSRATVDRWKTCLKEAWSAVGWHLVRNFIEKHFTKAGADEYRTGNVAYGETAGDDTYRARSGEGETGKAFWRSYNGRKQKRLGHQIPLLFSDRTRDGARRATIYATSNGLRVALPGVVHLNQYKPKSKKHGPHAGEPPVNLRADLLAISGRESEDMRKIFETTALSAWDANSLWHIYPG
jgi:hypothetical protein